MPARKQGTKPCRIVTYESQLNYSEWFLRPEMVHDSVDRVMPTHQRKVSCGQGRGHSVHPTRDDDRLKQRYPIRCSTSSPEADCDRVKQARQLPTCLEPEPCSFHTSIRTRDRLEPQCLLFGSNQATKSRHSAFPRPPVPVRPRRPHQRTNRRRPRRHTHQR